jgi:uncharacterized membrane protein YkoI
VSRWSGLLGLALLTGHGATPATAAPEICLGSGDVQEAIAQGKVIEPKAAIATARQRAPGAEVMRGGLCRQGEALIYQILILRKDGRLVHITIDGASGKVLRVDPP